MSHLAATTQPSQQLHFPDLSNIREVLPLYVDFASIYNSLREGMLAADEKAAVDWFKSRKITYWKKGLLSYLHALRMR